MKKAFITGITGQDGSYLAELLLSKGYEVHGLIRRSSDFNTHRIDHLYQDRHESSPRLFLHYGDLSDSSLLAKLMHEVGPDEIYNLAAQSHVRVSYDCPEFTGDVNGLGTVRLLEAVRDAGLVGTARFYQASASDLFGDATEVPQNENTPFRPTSPYATSKLYAYWSVVNYRNSYGLFSVNGIAFNHESPRRGPTFVTRKITLAASRIRLGLQKVLYLGDLEAQRDWGFAGDYVDGMWRSLQADKPDDYVFATGETHSVKEFLEEAFSYVDLDWHQWVKFDAKYNRPVEVPVLCGDASKARLALGWEPKVSFRALVKMMMDADLAVARRELAVATIR